MSCLHDVLKVQTCTRTSLHSLMYRRVLIHTMMSSLWWLLPARKLVIWFVVVHVKTVVRVSDHKMPAFSLPTLRAAQRNALDWQVAVYSGKRHVLLVKMVKRPLSVKL